MIVLDTTVLVYAVGDGHPYREPCRALIDAVASGRVQASTTVEVIQEFAHVRARRRDRTDAARLAGAYADLLAPLVTTTDVQLRAGLHLWTVTDGLGAFDAVLASAAMTAGASYLLSADAAFAGVHGLAHLVPDAENVGRLLGDG